MTFGILMRILCLDNATAAAAANDDHVLDGNATTTTSSEAVVLDAPFDSAMNRSDFCCVNLFVGYY